MGPGCALTPQVTTGKFKLELICGKKILECIACPMAVRSSGMSWGLFWERISGKSCGRSMLSSADPKEAGEIMPCSSHLVLLLLWYSWWYLLWYLLFSVFPPFALQFLLPKDAKALKGRPEDCSPGQRQWKVTLLFFEALSMAFSLGQKMEDVGSREFGPELVKS